MNRNAKSSFDIIKAASKNFEKNVSDALCKYRRGEQDARRDSERYKDTEGAYNSANADLKANARNAINRAEKAYVSIIKGELENLKEEFSNSLSRKCSPDFLTALHLYADFGLAPSKAEIESLLKDANGNIVALRALDSVLAKTGAKYRISTPGISEYEKDIAALERLAEGNIHWSDTDNHGALVDVYGGTARLMRADDGSLFDAGYQWDNTSLLISGRAFESVIKSLDGMADRWSGNVMPTVYRAELYGDKANDEQDNGEEQFAADQAETAKAAQIINNPDVAAENARTLTAADNAKAKAVLSLYMGIGGNAQ